MISAQGDLSVRSGQGLMGFFGHFGAIGRC
jgi:hypothetical protein